MSRTAFVMNIYPGTEEEYENRHKAVFPDLLAALKQVGVRNYSIYRNGLQLFAYMEVDNYDRAMNELSQDSANIRWQEYMAPIMQKNSDGGVAEVIAEVFHLD